MPCCHLPPGPVGNFFVSLQDDAEQFATYVGGGTPSRRVILPNFLTGALHLEMKLWRPNSPLRGYRINDAAGNAWRAMANRTTAPRKVYPRFPTLNRAQVFTRIIVPPRVAECGLLDYDDWILETITQLRLDGLANASLGGPWTPPGKNDKPPELATVGLGQKLINIYVKYELCWQRVGKWNRPIIVRYAAPVLANLSQFLCALHAPVDTILVEKLLALPVGQHLKKEGLLKPRGGSPLIQQSSDGTFRPWSKLDCLRTYYGLQLVLRRIAMATWPKGCACSASPDQAIKDCADWFNCNYAGPELAAKDWIQAACDLPKDVIDATVEAMKAKASDAS
ncbi:MAG: hypothetical protein RIS76_3302 [Verrucomicrobiota bacterium]